VFGVLLHTSRLQPFPGPHDGHHLWTVYAHRRSPARVYNVRGHIIISTQSYFYNNKNIINLFFRLTRYYVILYRRCIHRPFTVILLLTFIIIIIFYSRVIPVTTRRRRIRVRKPPTAPTASAISATAAAA